jgi:superfamily II RNA helicase
MKYKEFELDDFQVDAIKHINDNKSVVVSAGTGTGKTLVADYLIDKSIQENKRVIYTSPIKALSNQKFKDFKNQFGPDKIGLLTGDVSINPEGQILIMTTEIYRNMLLAQDPICDTLSYVIFDEIHYINDIERGTVWEESLIFSLPQTKILALSATIPNAKDMCDWIGSLRDEKVELVYYDHRAVPLNHYFFEHYSGLIERNKMPKKIAELKSFSRDPVPGRGKGKRRRKNFIQSKEISKNQFLELVSELRDKNWLPCIFFSFSRKACEQKAEALANKTNFASKETRNYIAGLFKDYFTPDMNRLKSVQLIKNCLLKGVGVHHAGLLPSAKDIVEHLFAEGKLKVLFATETFAVGINMPAKSVAFSSLEKFDGVNFRHLNTKEYFQMAGRAGRRGIDTVGFAITLLEPDFVDVDKVMYITSKDLDPIESQYTLSYNTTINLIKHHEDKEIERILKSNFGYFMKKRKEADVRIMATFKNQIKRLKKLGCIDEEGNILPKGNFMSFIYSEEILMTELVFSGILGRLSPVQINIVLASIVYEPKQMDYFSFKGADRDYKALLKLIGGNDVVDRGLNKLSLKRMVNIVSKWSNGCDFSDLMEYSNFSEGDYIRLFRQVIDRIQQIIKAGVDMDQEERLREAIKLLDKGVVKVDF